MNSLKGNYKFRISSPEQSERLQKVLFGMGYSWAGNEPQGSYADKSYIFIDNEHGVWPIRFGESEDLFLSQSNDEKDTEEFIAENTKTFVTKHTPKPPEANEWRENTGVMPVADHAIVDVVLKSGIEYKEWDASYAEWGFPKEGDTFIPIIKWRFHHAEDAVAYNTKAQEPTCVKEQPSGEFSGGNVNYYLLQIDNPKRLSPYECEAEDIIEALNMTFAEGNVFKALWRSCAMRVRGHGKAGQDEHGVYDGDKIAYYGERVKVQRRQKAE